MKLGVSLLAGIIFGLGLVVSGMANPNNVVAFLDIFGQWNPSLAFVMAGAIAAHAPLYFWIRKKQKPWFDDHFHIHDGSGFDRSLVIGSALFGIGWGLSGYCPGPALVATSMTSFHGASLLFVAAMVAGMKIVSLGSAGFELKYKNRHEVPKQNNDSCG